MQEGSIAMVHSQLLNDGDHAVCESREKITEEINNK